MKLKLLITMLALAATQVSAQDTLIQTPPPRRPFFQSNWGRALMSTAVPGTGQLSRHEWLRGSTYFGAEAVLAGAAIYYWQHSKQRGSNDHPGFVYDTDYAYGFATWYGLGALFTAADAWYATTSKRETVPMRAVWHSAVFPGWGQLANGKRWKAAGVFAAQTGLAFAAYTQHVRYQYYNLRGDVNFANFYKDDRNRLIWWSAGLLMLSCADAYVDCHMRDWNISPNLSWSPTYFPREKTVGLMANVEF